MLHHRKILFSHSYFLKLDPKQWKLGQPYPPLGTLYAAAVMREQGYNVSLFDSLNSSNVSTQSGTLPVTFFW